MPNVRTHQRSFAGGEVTPEFFGRIDEVKYQTGAATMRNFIALPHGPVANRPGTRFVREVKDSSKRTRLIPFTFSTTQTFAIELGAGYFRFHTQGATLISEGMPYEVANPYAEADLFDIHYVQSADVLTLVHPNYAPRELRRLGATNWTLTIIQFTPELPAPANPMVAIKTGTGNITYVYKVTAVTDNGLNESLPSTEALDPARSITEISLANPGVITTAVAHKLDVDDKIFLSSIGGMTQLASGFYLVDTVPTTTTLTIKTLAGVPVSTVGFSAYTSGGQIQLAGIKNDLLTSGNANRITWQPVPGAFRYNVYKQDNGLYGYIGQTDMLSFVDENIAADLGKTPPNSSNPFEGPGNYPGAASYFEQRRCFAGTLNKPQNIWMTKSGTESNLSFSLPTRDDDSINFRIAAREANTIRHIVPLSDLVLLTSSAEWRITSQNTDALTPTSISVKPQSYIGVNNAQPVIINNTLLYAAARGGHIRELGYSDQAAGYITGDLSLRAPHLFDGLDIVDMAYAKAPQPVIWFVSSNGSLLGLTYVPEQSVSAWHRHDTDGTFESVCIVAEGVEDALYVVVKRTVNGQVKRYVERMADRLFGTQTNAYFVDAGLSYDGAPAMTFSGLGHLEGKTVNILVDGAVHPQRTVAGGQVTLDVPGSVVHIGLPITADLKTLPLAMGIDTGFGQGRFKNINKVFLRVFMSSGIFVGPSETELTEAKQRTIEDYGTPPALKSEEIEVVVDGAWQDSGQIVIRQSDPLPLTIVSINMEVSVGG